MTFLDGVVNLSPLIDTVVKLHRVRYAEDSSQLKPMVMLIKNNEIISVNLVPELLDNGMKPLVKSFLADLVVEQGAQGYILCSEVWLAAYDQYSTQEPSERPDRVGALLTMGFSRDGCCDFRLQKIIRDAFGDVIDLHDMPKKGSVVGSRFNIYERVYH